MKKLISFLFLIIIINLAADAQQEPLFSNYMFGQTISNPSFVGKEDAVNALFSNRSMFTGIEGNPVTSVFGIEAPITILGERNGLGLLFTKDELGLQSTVKVQISYSFQKDMKFGRLGGGLSFGMNNFSVGGDWVVPTSDHHVDPSSDTGIPKDFSDMTFGLGFGAYIETSKYYLSIAATNLNSAKLKTLDTGYEFYYYVPHFYLSGAYNIELPNPLFELKPSFMLRTDMAAVQLDINSVVYIKGKYWVGGGFRFGRRNLAAIDILGGIEMISGLTLGYALDINTTEISRYALTSNEVIVTYSFNLDFKKNQKYKSIRYL